ncbi:Cytochrome P450 [Corchorus capsularis]|uniref:Cytochrome P450 n=1 Tax=Corchorus capsularis TaxID=210143 RepID=A0A1R3JGD5_COCAP|nr:Cytochrome P450 [Corchorus capsularis]
MDECIRRYLSSWAALGVVDAKEATSKMAFEYSAKKIISYDEERIHGKVRESFKMFTDGLVSFPLNIPGTAYHASMQGRKNAMKVIKDIVAKRKLATKSGGEIENNDFLDYLLNQAAKEDNFFNESIAENLVFFIFFAANETTSPALTIAIKLIADHPQVLAELRKEHEAILRNRSNNCHESNSNITWQEYKSMTFTHMVINEVIRVANIASGLFRKVVKDVEIKGYTIPEGWLVYAAASVVHMDPNIYEDPCTFNPWRWEGKELNAGSKTFMAFGGGVRLCVGAEFAKLQMAILIHHLVTKYRWSVLDGGKIIRKPYVTFPNGLHIEISELK